MIKGQNAFLCILFIFFLTSTLNSATPLYRYDEEDLSVLLEAVENESDMSTTTKKEAAGHVIVFTRQDIERMQIKTLKELLLYVPFMRVAETNYGLTDILYDQRGRTSENLLSLYIDDQKFSLPYQGSALQYYSQISLQHIDYVEIYWGFPSFTFDINGVSTLVKLYTKKPERENINVVSTELSSLGSYALHGFSANKFEDFSYLLSLNHEEFKRKKLYAHEGYPLKRGQNTNQLYSIFYKDKSQITLSALRGDYDTFIGESGLFKPKDGELKFKHINLGFSHEEEDDWSMYVNYSHSNTKSHSSMEQISVTHPIIGLVISKKIPKDILFPRDFPKQATLEKDMGIYEKDLDERLLGFGLVKHFYYGDDNKINIGLRGQYKDFDYNKYVFAGHVANEKDFIYTKEFATSFYLEDNYLISDENILTAAFKYSYYDRDRKIDNSKSFNLSLGYIHNEEDWFTKTYIRYGEQNSDAYLFSNYYILNEQLPDSSNEKLISHETGYKGEDLMASFLFSYMNMKEKDPNSSQKHFISALTFDYDIDLIYHLRGMYWYSKSKWQDQSPPLVLMFATLQGKDASKIIKNRRGAYISLDAMYDKLTLTNTLYFNQNDKFDRGFIYNIGANYKAKKDLELSLKAVNLFKNVPQATYYGIHEHKLEITSFKAPIFDRQVWFSVEYSF